MLEVLNTVITAGLPHNPELVYALLHRQEVFTPFEVRLLTLALAPIFFEFNMRSARLSPVRVCSRLGYACCRPCARGARPCRRASACPASRLKLWSSVSPPCADDGKVWRCLARMHPDTLDARVLCWSVRDLGCLYPSKWACTVP